MLAASALISGLGLGSMYGLLALGFYMTYSVSSTVNFSQGSSMMLGAVFTYAFSVRLGWPFPVAVLAALLLCAAYGILVERIGIRPFVRRGSNAWPASPPSSGIAVHQNFIPTPTPRITGLIFRFAAVAPVALTLTSVSIQIFFTSTLRKNVLLIGISMPA